MSGTRRQRNTCNGISCINDHLKVTYRKSKEETVEKYRGVLYSQNEILRDNGSDTNPRHITEEDIQGLVDNWEERGLAVSTKKWYTHILRRYLEFYDNSVISDMGLDFGQDTRPHADWLSEEDYKTLMTAPMTPLEEIVIHLELCLGLRVVEVCRLDLEDIHYDEDKGKRSVSVRGKGKGDGKWRSVPFHPDTEAVLGRWMRRRAEIVENVRRYNPYWKDPGSLLLWCHYQNKPDAGRYGARSHSLDRMVIHQVRDRLGIQFSNHTLRRTFGRTMYRAGTPIEAISKIYGHEDIRTTVAYLGIDLDDMNAALEKMYEYQQELTEDCKKEEV